MRKTVLIVDNEQLLGDLLRLAIESDACGVRMVTSVENAEAEILRQPPDLLLANPSLPRGLRLLGSATVPPGTRKIALTSSQTMRGIADKMDVEVVDKEGPLSELVHKLRSILDLDSLPSTTTHESILVVYDDAEVRGTLATFLESNGYVVSTAPSGQDALDRLDRDSTIAVVLLDIQMPGLGGIQVLAESMKRARPPVVIMLSGVSDQEVARHAMKLGAFDYIVKPPDVLRVEATISAGMSHARYEGGSLWQKILRKASH